MIAALQRVAKKMGRTPCATYGIANSYAGHKVKGEPTAAIIIAHFGSWNTALKAAGLPLNPRRGPGPSTGWGAKRWSDEQLLRAVRYAVAQCRNKKLTVRRYETIRHGRLHGFTPVPILPGEPGPILPGVAIIRRRLRKSVGTWSDIVEAAGGVSTPKHPANQRSDDRQ
jgi:hypothetical protein